MECAALTDADYDSCECANMACGDVRNLDFNIAYSSRNKSIRPIVRGRASLL